MPCASPKSCGIGGGSCSRSSSSPGSRGRYVAFACRGCFGHRHGESLSIYNVTSIFRLARSAGRYLRPVAPEDIGGRELPGRVPHSQQCGPLTRPPPRHSGSTTQEHEARTGCLFGAPRTRSSVTCARSSPPPGSDPSCELCVARVGPPLPASPLGEWPKTPRSGPIEVAGCSRGSEIRDRNDRRTG